MFPNIRADLERYVAMAGHQRRTYGQTVDLIFTQGVWALVVYRYGAWIRRVRIPGFSLILKAIYFLLNKIVEVVTGISIPSSAKIGSGLYIGHFGGIFVHGRATLGSHCSIGTGVTIGTRGLGNQGVPVIGDNVFVGVGAKIIGGITVGNNVRIGANSVVLSDVPDDATVVGIPARIVKQREDGRDGEYALPREITDGIV